MGACGSCLSECVLFPVDDIINGQEDDTDIEPEAPVLHIPDIVFDPPSQLFLVLDLPPVSMDLRPARNTGLHEMPDHVLVHDTGELHRLIEHVRAWPHYRHIPFQDIHQLWKFIQTSSA